jgi:hypothetical protein
MGPVKLVSLNKVCISHGQSTCSIIRRASRQRCASPGLEGRGPSAATYRRGGRALRIAAKEARVCLGLLNIKNKTGGDIMVSHFYLCTCFSANSRNIFA